MCARTLKWPMSNAGATEFQAARTDWNWFTFCITNERSRPGQLAYNIPAIKCTRPWKPHSRQTLTIIVLRRRFDVLAGQSTWILRQNAVSSLPSRRENRTPWRVFWLGGRGRHSYAGINCVELQNSHASSSSTLASFSLGSSLYDSQILLLHRLLLLTKYSFLFVCFVKFAKARR